MKTLLNKIIDFFFEKKHVKKPYLQLTNQKMIDGLAKGKLFVACIIGRDKKNFIAQQIRKFSGPFVHVETILNDNKYMMTEAEQWNLVDKFAQYYINGVWPIEFVVMASAKDTGMEYYDLAEDQNREMEIFDVTDSKSDSIITEFLSKKVMNNTYDYTWIWGKMWQYIFRKFKKLSYKIIKFFDDEHAYGCSEQAEIFERHGVKISDVKEPNPTEIYRYCKQHYPVVYSSLTREY